MLAKLYPPVGLHYRSGNQIANLLHGKICLSIHASLLALLRHVAKAKVMQFPDGRYVEIGPATEIIHVRASAAAEVVKA